MDCGRILADVRRFNWLAAGRRWRKTTGFGVCPAVEAAAARRIVFWGAPTYDQVPVGWDEMRRAAGSVAELNQGRMTVIFPTGGRVVFRSLDDPDNARGHTADRVILDEAAFIKARAWYEVVRPMLIDTGGDLFAMTSPNGLNWFHHEWSRAVAGESSDAAGWRAPTLGARVADRVLVREAHPLENPDIAFSELDVNLTTKDSRRPRTAVAAQANTRRHRSSSWGLGWLGAPSRGSQNGSSGWWTRGCLLRVGLCRNHNAAEVRPDPPVSLLHPVAR